MKQINQLEESLVKANKSMPELPADVKDFLVKALPWLSLIGGLWGAWMAWHLWRWAHAVSSLYGGLNDLAHAYGVDTGVPGMTTWLWVWLAFYAAYAVIYLMAFSPLKSMKKAGWNLLFLGSLVYLGSGIVSIFVSNYTSGGGIIGAAFGTAISWFILFQVRDRYSADKTAPKTKA